MRSMVCGFAFTGDLVYLIWKSPDRGPAAVRGKLNGIGGHVEPGESSLAAMVREFREEAGVSWDRWRLDVHMVGDGWEVRFYSTHLDDGVWLRTTGDEEVIRLPIGELYKFQVVPNLRWLIPLCLDPHIKKPVLVIDQDWIPPKLQEEADHARKD